MEEYCISDSEKSAIRANLSISEEKIKTLVQILKDWIKTRPDIPLESQDETFLELMLLRAKFKESTARRNIENYYKKIGHYPEFFTNFRNLQPLNEVGVAIMVPKLTCLHERIVILKVIPDRIENLKIKRCILMGLATAFIAFFNDYSASYRLILDFEGFLLKHAALIELNDLLKLLQIHENILKMRISGIEIINAPELVNFLLNIAKVALKPKLLQRITPHKDLHSLHANVAKECLPCDYGGELASIQEFIGKWDEIYKIQKSLFEKIECLVDELKGGKDVGSFKMLDFD